ncbi:hypothetical protein CR513_07035, partial [Mucuna pruriens]
MRWALDEMSYIDITKLIKSIGYVYFKSLWYQHLRLSLSQGLKPLNCDGDVLKFVEDVKTFEVVSVFVKHLIDTPTKGKNDEEFRKETCGAIGGKDEI